MQATSRMASVVSSTLLARRRLIRDVRLLRLSLESLPVSSSSSTPPASSEDLALTPVSLRSLAIFLGSVYLVTVIVASFTIDMCGPGCSFVFYFILAGVSGLLMFRPPFGSRLFCFIVLLLSLLGMGHEKEARETYVQRALRAKVQSLQKHIEEVESK